MVRSMISGVGRLTVLAGLLAVGVLVSASCGADGDDRASTPASTSASTTGSTAIDAVESSSPPSGPACPDEVAATEPGQLGVELLSPVAFVDGAQPEPGNAMAGHTHTGPLVVDGQAHLHYCLGLANGYDAPVTLSAIIVMPDAEEEPLAVVEAESLDEAFVDPEGPDAIAAGRSAVLEILVPADGPIDQLHQRIAFTVDEPAGPRDLFVDVTRPASGP